MADISKLLGAGGGGGGGMMAAMGRVGGLGGMGGMSGLMGGGMGGPTPGYRPPNPGMMPGMAPGGGGMGGPDPRFLSGGAIDSLWGGGSNSDAAIMGRRNMPGMEDRARMMAGLDPSNSGQSGGGGGGMGMPNFAAMAPYFMAAQGGQQPGQPQQQSPLRGMFRR